VTALLLAVTLSWTVPSRTEAGTVLAPREARIYRHRQSRAWVAMHPAMQLDGDVWAATWPSVRREAAPVLVATIPLSDADCGRKLTWSTTNDTVTTFYFVTTVDTAGRESRQSNEVGK